MGYLLLWVWEQATRIGH